jgi:hypothetical protein
MLSGLMGYRTEQMQGIGMACIHRQHLAIDPLSLCQLAGPMVPQTGFQYRREI